MRSFMEALESPDLIALLLFAAIMLGAEFWLRVPL
jgi:hypothetical protein